MSAPLTLDREAIAELCRQYGVKRLAIFGSAVRDDFDLERSDVDLVGEYLPGVTSLESYFVLEEKFEELFGRSVDLRSAVERQLSIVGEALAQLARQHTRTGKTTSTSMSSPPSLSKSASKGTPQWQKSLCRYGLGAQSWWQRSLSAV